MPVAIKHILLKSPSSSTWYGSVPHITRRFVCPGEPLPNSKAYGASNKHISRLIYLMLSSNCIKTDCRLLSYAPLPSMVQLAALPQPYHSRLYLIYLVSKPHTLSSYCLIESIPCLYFGRVRPVNYCRTTRLVLRWLLNWSCKSTTMYVWYKWG